MQKNKSYLSFLFRKSKYNRYILQTVVLLIGFCLTACSAYADKPEVNHFIDKMVKKYHFDRQQLQQLFKTVKPNRFIISSFAKPKESLTWSDYKPIFVTEKRARNGVKFWNEHKQTLRYAQQHYGIPPAVIVAILGVETRYGEVTGKYRVLDSLSTLSFNHTRRADFFQSELEQFLLLGRENPTINPKTTKGSYAGAIGQVQFMPSNYRHLAVDASRKGYSDLINNSDDAILSIANYLKYYGWVKDGPVATRVKNKNQSMQHLPASFKGFTLKTFEKYHIYPNKPLPSQLKTTLVALPIKHGKEYWLGFTNFQAIKRYNASSLYAMAVYQLSELINHYYQQEQHLHVNKK
ncbi:lytic murein transglycosylase B [Rickettsiella endosymbiont of Dermanyssus gallinae]|uniref:lytic murein transglycosylase B n=1 Tax=Rickettsiella endosymbiont of Dermanyssus gallinae TaxID=2856608 RepID=UPI001C529EEB|nr:lytic murein transglycosylase B [Rickettsiella endosymbiont of Dermanyssus gallinae]